MCTLALYIRVFDDYPMIVAANRDEHYDRPSAAPAVMESNPRMIAGKDLRAGGTWLGVNEHGLMVGILNRRSNTNPGDPLPPAGSRSRGQLCLDLLRLENAVQAMQFIDAHVLRYNPFTLVFASQTAAYVAYNDEHGIHAQALDEGLHVFSSAAELDLHSPKAARAHELFAGLIGSGPSNVGPLHGWLPGLQNILADHSVSDGFDDPGEAICVHREASGTVSASVIFYSQAKARFETFHCLGAPCQNSFGASIALPTR